MRNKEDNKNINYRINEIEWKRKRLRIIKLEIWIEEWKKDMK